MPNPSWIWEERLGGTWPGTRCCAPLWAAQGKVKASTQAIIIDLNSRPFNNPGFLISFSTPVTHAATTGPGQHPSTQLQNVYLSANSICRLSVAVLVMLPPPGTSTAGGPHR